VGYLDTINRVLTKDFKQATPEEKDRASRDVIEICSLACAGLVLQPVPLLEQAVLPIQAGMVLAVGHIFGQELTKKRAGEVVLDIAAITGVSVVTRQALTTLAKILLPVVGGILSAPYAFSVTWATGYAAIHYFRAGGKPDKERIRKIFEEERERSRGHYSESKARENRPSEEDLEASKDPKKG
jgi:uncharacterized protein (DUF697 family)